MQAIVANVALLLVCCGCVQGARTKRTILFPHNLSGVQYIAGVGFPVDLKDENVLVGIDLKSYHFLPENSSDYTNIIFARSKRSISRWDVYKIMEQYTEMYGFGGKGCVLRAICQLSENPVDKSSGIIQEILHVLFTPTTTNEVIQSQADNEYYSAQKIGRNIKGNCAKHFPDCKASFVDIFTTFRE